MAEEQVEGSGTQDVSPSEQEASRLGWEPEDKWHGKAEDWVDADTFLRRGREINSVLKKSLRERDAQIAKLTSDLASMSGTVAELAEYRHNLEKTVYDRAMADLKSQLRTARVEGDIERVADVEEAIDTMKDQAPKPAPKTATPATPVEPPEFVAWKTRNTWYSPDNPKMIAYADGVALSTIQAIQRAGRTPTPAEVLAKVDEEVRDMFPQAFQTRQAPMVESSGGSGSSTSSPKGKGFSSLPADVKAQFERFYASGYYIDMATKKPLPKAEAQAEYFKDYS